MKAKILLPLFVVALAGCDKPQSTDQAATAPIESSSPSAMAPPAETSAPSVANVAASPAPVAAAEPESKWSYSTNEDKMRKSRQLMASLMSSDQIQLSSPYDGGSDLMLSLRDDPKYGKDILLVLTKGQMSCPSYQGCSFSVKFDNGPIQNFRAYGSSNGRNDVLFINGQTSRKKFLASLRAAKRMIVEVDIFQAGRQQFTFEPTGLTWKWF